MALCHPSPPRWMLTDARLDQHGLAAARHLPPGAIIIVRSDDLPRHQRLRLIRALRRIATARRLRLFLAAMPVAMVRRFGADGVHVRDRSAAQAALARRLGLSSSAPVHDGAEARAVAKAGIGHALISPLYATRSHAGAKTLGIRRFVALAHLTRARASALGGMTARRHRALRRRTAHSGIGPGWAAIDAWETL